MPLLPQPEKLDNKPTGAVRRYKPLPGRKKFVSTVPTFDPTGLGCTARSPLEVFKASELPKDPRQRREVVEKAFYKECASGRGDDESVELLEFMLVNGVQPQFIKQGFQEWAPLHAAAAKGNATVVSLLLGQEGVSINVRDVDRMTPLHVAVQSNQADAVEALLMRKANPLLKDKFGMRPMDYVTGSKDLNGSTTNHAIRIRDLLCAAEQQFVSAKSQITPAKVQQARIPGSGRSMSPFLFVQNQAPAWKDTDTRGRSFRQDGSSAHADLSDSSGLPVLSTASILYGASTSHVPHSYRRDRDEKRAKRLEKLDMSASVDAAIGAALLAAME